MSALHHLALGTRDVEGLSAFYREALGLSESARQFDEAGALHSVWLRLGGDAVLMIEKTDQGPRAASESRIEPGLFLFVLHGGAEMDERLSAAGLAPVSRTDHTRYFRDPDGNRFAVSDYPLP